MDQQKFCYIDCTDTFNSGLKTGIQRVVRNIICRLEGLNGFEGYRFVPVITIGAEIYRLKPEIEQSYRVTRTVNAALSALRNLLDSFLSRSEPIREAAIPAPQQSPAPATSAPAGILNRVHWTIVSGCRMVIPSLLKLAMLLDTSLLGDSKVELAEGDTFFFADSFWSASGLAALHNARLKRAKIILLVYDIIPVTHPAFVDEIHRRKFTELLDQYLGVVDGVISISKYAMDEVVQYCRQHGIGRDIVFDYFHLGADFAPEQSAERSDDRQVTELGSQEFFLMIGTIEPRKNHVYVLDAFERLWQSGSNQKLCIVGKVGWKCDAIMKRLTGSGFLNSKLFIFNNLNDPDLRYLLKRARAVVMASMVEGFGLPVVEAMHYNKTLLASDIPVLREVGGSYPIYFPLDDNELLSELVVQVSSGSLSCNSSGKGWLSWDESVRTLVQKVVAISEATG
jgi:alpha-1,2-rhamnosyltransferase